MTEFRLLQAKAYEYLKESILRKELEFGVTYSETKLARELNISRTPMRDALHRLAQEGYIDIVPSKDFSSTGFPNRTYLTSFRRGLRLRAIVRCA